MNVKIRPSPRGAVALYRPSSPADTRMGYTPAADTTHPQRCPAPLRRGDRRRPASTRLQPRPAPGLSANEASVLPVVSALLAKSRRPGGVKSSVSRPQQERADLTPPGRRGSLPSPTPREEPSRTPPARRGGDVTGTFPESGRSPRRR